MAAAYFANLFPDLEITLIESRRIPPVGVGEATVPFLNLFLARIGYPDPHDWMPSCDATYKTGILFENWYERGDSYWHPFEYLDYLGVQHHTGHCWCTWHRQGEPQFQSRKSFSDAFFPSTRLNVEWNRAPSFREYAYHLDAQRFGEFLRRAAPRVRHVLAEVSNVILDEKGRVFAVCTEEGDLRADLYLDCTGFKRRIISRVDPDQPYLSYSSSLLCDRAVVIRMPYGPSQDREKVIHPYVRASARSGGWIWSIPLFSRMSSGYVYSSAFLSDDEAEEELRAYWRQDGARASEALRIRFETGRLPSIWSKNCIAIGLASGFIEPLESTGLAITQTGIELAASMLDSRYYDEEIVSRYNALMGKFYSDIAQFIVAHYCLTNREDTSFWKAVKFETHRPADLEARLEVFRRYLPTSGTKGTSELFMFRDISWFAVLLGMNFPFEPDPVDRKLLLGARQIQERKREFVREMSRKLPNHYRFLKETIYGRP